jgi:hypothetical protein
MKLSQDNKSDALVFSAKQFALRAVLHARVPHGRVPAAIFMSSGAQLSMGAGLINRR